MSTTISEYYLDELERANRQVVAYRREIFELESKLAAVIRRNSIPGLAALVEQQQDKLNRVSKKFDLLQVQFHQQQAALKTDDKFVDDSLIKTQTEVQQNELRQLMQACEKEYVDAKHDCSNFLSGLFKKR